MAGLELTLTAIALAAHVFSASVATANLIETIQTERAEAEQAEQSNTVYTFGDTITVDGVEIVVAAAD